MESLQTKYGHVFVEGEDQYLFIKILGTGLSAAAQLVLHMQTGELVVRKVEKRLLDEEQIEEEDPERILFSVQSQARQRGVQLNISHLYSADHKPAPQKAGGRKLLFHRVRYFKFYNGGNLSDFYIAYETRDVAPPPSLVCNMVKDVVRALHFLYTMNPSFVLHGDLHRGNIFLHWEQNASGGPSFFLGDFGRSTCGTVRPGNTFGLVADIRQVGLHMQILLCTGTDSGFQSELREYLEAVVEPELLRLARGPGTELPDLTHLVELLSAAPAATQAPSDMLPFMITRETHSTPSPLLYDTREEARKARGIHGPWNVGEVSINPSIGKVAIVSMSPDTHHRTYSICLPDDTDSEDDCSGLV